jgi:hypothetical protein
MSNIVENDLLALLVDYCAIVQRRAAQCLRFGPHSVQGGQSLTHSMRLSSEIGELDRLISVAEEQGLLHVDIVDSSSEGKARYFEKLLANLRAGAA